MHYLCLFVSLFYLLFKRQDIELLCSSGQYRSLYEGQTGFELLLPSHLLRSANSGVGHHKWLLWQLEKLLFYILYRWMFCLHACLVSLEASRRHRSSWDWSYWWFITHHTGAGSQPEVLWKSSEHRASFQTLSCIIWHCTLILSMPIVPPVPLIPAHALPPECPFPGITGRSWTCSGPPVSATCMLGLRARITLPGLLDVWLGNAC